MKDYIKK